MGTPPEPGDSALQEPYLSAARSQLDETSWQEAWAEGRAMTLEEAISYDWRKRQAADLSACGCELKRLYGMQTPREHPPLEDLTSSS